MKKLLIIIGILITIILMDEQIRQIVKDELQNYTPTFTNMNVPPHTHNGADSQQIQSSNLLPYTINTRATTSPSGTSNMVNGVIQLYNFTSATNGTLQDWGITMSLGGIWNSFSVVPSAVSATQATAQTIATATPTAIVFDDVETDLYPAPTAQGAGTVTIAATGTSVTGSGTSFTTLFVVGDQIVVNGQINYITVITDNTHMTVSDAWLTTGGGLHYFYYVTEYDPNTGVFTPYTAGRYLITGGVTFTSVSHAGNASLAITLQRNASTTTHMTKSIYVPSVGGGGATVTVEVTGIVEALENDSWYLVLTQNTGASQTTLLDDNTWINIQKMK